MRLLLDESLPRRLRTHLSPHEVRTVPEMGWSGKSNGSLLKLAEEEFDAFLTADQNLPNQQNLKLVRIRIGVLTGKSNRLHDLEPLAPRVLNVLSSIEPGSVAII